MDEIRREGERRAKLKTRFTLARKIVWSWLTDPAVLLYRREAHGRERARVTTVEFFLFVREVTREFYNIEGTSRAASLAYTTLLSLIPLLVAFTQSCSAISARSSPISNRRSTTFSTTSSRTSRR